MPVHSIAEIVNAIHGKKITPLQVLSCSYQQLKKTHEWLNALVQPQYDDAQEACTRVDRDSPLSGVPASIKECFPVQGLKTTLGISSRCGLVDAEDASIVQQLKACGVVSVGKSNVPQAMYLHETTNPVWGQTNHPETKARSPGGSSGGDAALVAAGVVPLGVGNDLAGSVRQPAHACGVPSLLPSSNVLGSGGAFTSMPNFRVVSSRAGFLAANVADLRIVADSLELVQTREEPSCSQRIAVWEDAGIIEPSPAVKRAIREASQVLIEAGHRVEFVQDDVSQKAAWVMFGLLSADGGSDIQQLFGGDKPIPAVTKLLRIGGMPRWVRPLLSVLMEIIGNRIDAAALMATGPRSEKGFKELVSKREQFIKHMQNIAEKFDAIICPVSALPALQHGTAARLVVAASPCLLANLVDLPAGVVPVTRVREDEQNGRAFSVDRVLRTAIQTDKGSVGLPIGVQIIGLNGDPSERTVLDLMQVIESRVNFRRWAHQ